MTVLPAHFSMASATPVSESVREQLLADLYSVLPRESIAAMAVDNPARARTEVATALGAAANRRGLTAGVSSAWRERAVAEIVAELLGLGPIDSLVADPSVTEIMVNGTSSLYYERGGRLFEHPVRFRSEAQLRTTIDRIISPLGRRLDEQNPLVSGRLPEGHRIHAAIPPIAIDGSVLTIRKFRSRSYNLEDLVAEGAAPSKVMLLLRWAVRSRLNIAVSGGTGTGKTTLLNALAACVDQTERIITIEDSAELRFDAHPHVVRLEARPSNQEGSGRVTIRELVINALRMRPDRIVVGEVRGEEALEMLQAMNTGHDGSMTTLHANSPREVPQRLLTMVGYSGLELPAAQIAAQVSSAIDLIVHLERGRDGSRRIAQIAELGLDGSGWCRTEPLVSLELSAKGVGTVGGPRWSIHSGGSVVRSALERGVASEQEVAEWQNE